MASHFLVAYHPLVQTSSGRAASDRSRVPRVKSPAQLRHAHMVEVFGRIPGTLNPPQITPNEMNRLLRLATKPTSLRLS